MQLWKKLPLLMMCGAISLFMVGCGNIQLWEQPPVTEAQYESGDKLKLNTYYVKNGTKFSEVYMPMSSFSGIARYVDQSRVIYMFDDQPMIPEHYKNEIVAYSSTSADMDQITLERFKDMGWSIGIYGGKIENDGYYHLDSKEDVVPNSQAAEIFSKVRSNEIRIVSIGNVPISKVTDENSGLITSLSKGQDYLMEFYAGTFFYRQYFTADVQFLKAMELYTYGTERISDTLNGYLSFETPDTLKSGYYCVNNKGLFLYHAFTKEEYMENEDLNESGFSSEAEALASYSQEFKISVPYDTKDVIINASISNIDNNASGKIVAPDGTIYDMTVLVPEKSLKLELSVAKAGEWMCYIPQYLNVLKVDVEGSEIAETTVCDATTYTYEEPVSFQRFYIPVYGTGRVYGYMTREGDLRTFDFTEAEQKTNTGKQRYLYLDMPYMEAGEYEVKIYYYQSSTELGTMQISDYVDSNSDIIIIE